VKAERSEEEPPKAMQHRPGTRGKKVVALVAAGRSYRLICRDLGSAKIPILRYDSNKPSPESYLPDRVLDPVRLSAAILPALWRDPMLGATDGRRLGLAFGW
jgi:hypothetical protein